MKVRAIVIGTVAAMTLMGCSSDVATEPDPELTVSAAAPTGGSFTAEQQEVVDATIAYLDGGFRRGTTPLDESLDGKATQRFLDDAVGPTKKAIDDKGLKWFGDYTFDADTVKIDRDDATITGCLDASTVLLIPKDADRATNSSGAGPHQVIEYNFKRVGGTWLLDMPFGEQSTC